MTSMTNISAIAKFVTTGRSTRVSAQSIKAITYRSQDIRIARCSERLHVHTFIHVNRVVFLLVTNAGDLNS
jgi:hypothetical protein